MDLNEYLLMQLTNSKERINKLVEQIVSAAHEMEMKHLVTLPERLRVQKDAHKQLVSDCAKYCTVDQLIEISLAKDKYSDKELDLIDAHTVAYHFKYHYQGVSISDRDKLVKRFGSSLKEAKVR